MRKGKTRYRSLSKYHTKREVVTGMWGIQVNPTEFAFLSQNVDSLHPSVPLPMGIERRSAPLRLGIDRHLVKVPILPEVGHLPRGRPFMEMRMKLLEQVFDHEGPLKIDGTCQNGMIERDAETSV